MSQMNHGVGTFNGFGTKWIEARDGGTKPRAATKWLVALYMPLIPLGKFVLQPDGDPTHQNWGTGSRSVSQFYVLGQLRVNLLECIFTLFWRWLIFAPLCIVAAIWLPALAVFLAVQVGFLSDSIINSSGFWLFLGLLALFAIGVRMAFPLIDRLIRFEKMVLSYFDPTPRGSEQAA